MIAKILENPALMQLIGNLLTLIGGVLVALIASGRFWDHIEKKKGGIGEKVDKIEKQLTEHIENQEAKEKLKGAKDARRRLLRFSDELQNDVRHSQEYFSDILDDCDTYDHYCVAHPDFPNSKTVAAETNIKACYQQCLAEHEFAMPPEAKDA